MTVPVRYRLDPTTQAGLLTTSSAAADAAAAAGYSTDEGTVFDVATRPGGAVAVHELRRGTGDQIWSTNADEVRSAVQGYGYADQGVVAYVSPVASSCTVQVRRFQSHGVHRYAATTGQQDALRLQGWVAEGSFYAAQAPGAGTDVTPTAAASPTPGQAPGTARPTGPQTVIDAHFDHERTGPVTPASFIAAVGPATHDDAAYEAMSYVRADRGAGYVVRTHLAAHEILGRNDAPGDGNVLVVALQDQTHDSACVSYDVRFSPGFEVSAGGKLPGLLGVAPGVSPATPTGGGSTDHGWSGRMMWLGPSLSRLVRDSGQPDLAVTYLYHPGQTGTFGDDISWVAGWSTARGTRCASATRSTTSAPPTACSGRGWTGRRSWRAPTSSTAPTRRCTSRTSTGRCSAAGTPTSGLLRRAATSTLTTSTSRSAEDPGGRGGGGIPRNRVEQRGGVGGQERQDGK